MNLRNLSYCKVKRQIALSLLVCLSLSILADVDLSAGPAYKLDDLGGKTDLFQVRCVGQDSDGCIWFGTETQLMAYDGCEVRSCYCDLGKFFSNSIQIDGNVVYLGTNEGLLIYDRVEDSFRYDDDLRNVVIRALLIYDDKLFVGSDKGLHIFDISSLEKSEINLPDRLLELQVYSLSENRGVIYIGTSNSICTYDVRKGTILESPISNVPGRISFVEGLYVDDAIVLAGSPNGLTRINMSSGPDYLHRFQVVKTIIRDDKGYFLVGTDNGVFSYSLTGDEASPVFDAVAYCTFMDRDRNIWLGTDNGLRVIKQSRLFKSIDLPSGAQSAVFSSALKDSRGRLWLCTNKGLMLRDEEKGAVWFSTENPDNRLIHNKIKDIVEMPDHRIVASSDVGLLIFNEQTRQMDRKVFSGIHNWFYDLEPDGKDLLVASYDGLLRIDDEASLRHYTFFDGSTGNDVSQVVSNSKGSTYVLTRNQKVFCLDEREDIFQPVDLSIFKRPIADHILMDSNDCLWVVSRNEICSLAPDGKWTPVDMGGVSLMTVNDIVEYEGTVLCCTDNGLLLVDSSHRASFVKTSAQYLNAACDAGSQSIYLLTRGRVDVVSWDDVTGMFSKKPRLPKVTEIVANGDYSVPYRELLQGKVVLDEGYNDLVISLSNFDFSDNTPQQFIYRLDKKPWRPLQASNQIVLTHLSAGRHSVELTAGGESESKLLQLIIKRPWYFSWLMILVYIFTALAVAAILIRNALLVRKMKVEKDKREAALSVAKEKENFFVNVAHELKTPLSLVIAPLGKLISETDDESSLKTLRIAQDNALKLNAMVHDTIGIYCDSADVAGCVTLVEVDFPELVNCMMSSYIESYKNLEFVVNCQPQPLVLELDLTKMEAIINNLVSNACKYTQQGGSVILTAYYSRQEQMLELSVSDTGIGIPRDELPFVFRRFFESSRTKGGQYDSTGLGLSIIKNYVEALQGSATVASDENGTSLKVLIPCRDVSHPETGEGETSSVDEGKPQIVIVDDNLQICSFLENSLSEEYRCISVHNGRSGIKLCKDVHPDLIISDIIMPVMDGLDMCREIRSYAPLSVVPIILLTAKGSMETELQSLTLNIDAFIPKPFDIRLLKLKIKQLLMNKSRIETSLRIEMASEVSRQIEPSQDEKFLKNLTQYIEDHIDESNLTVTTLSEVCNLPEKQVYRKLKQLTGMSTVEYIRSIRLKKAALLLRNGSYTVAEVMYNVGFSSISYFSRIFAAEYGKAPSAYMKDNTVSNSPE